MVLPQCKKNKSLRVQMIIYVSYFQSIDVLGFWFGRVCSGPGSSFQPQEGRMRGLRLRVGQVCVYVSK